MELFSGAALTAAIVLGTYAATRAILKEARHRSTSLGDGVELLLAWTCLAARNLEEEATSVTDALAVDDLALSRTRLARIVGRDTQHLNPAEISRAVIETIAESASDGMIAPLFYMAIGGVPLAMAYKAINTLDSMIGHADERYFYFGKVAARLDDLANYVPARLTASAILLASLIQNQTDVHAAWQTWVRDGDQHKSPNAGQPESAIAGALHVRLGGPNTYAGELIPAAQMGREFPEASLPKARTAIRLISLVTMIGVTLSIVLAASAQSSRRPKGRQ
jgi:adenosylcobinamide-phosphate synthase